jgi:hypothetical protein
MSGSRRLPTLRSGVVCAHPNRHEERRQVRDEKWHVLVWVNYNNAWIVDKLRQIARGRGKHCPVVVKEQKKVHDSMRGYEIKRKRSVTSLYIMIR